MDKSDPSMYAMIKWMEEANKQSCSDGLSFEEFVTNASYFFTQRHHDQGLKYIFELYDPQKKGYLDKSQLREIFQDLKFEVTHDQLNKFFESASGDKKKIDFIDFSRIMRDEH